MKKRAILMIALISILIAGMFILTGCTDDEKDEKTKNKASNNITNTSNNVVNNAVSNNTTNNNQTTKLSEEDMYKDILSEYRDAKKKIEEKGYDAYDELATDYNNASATLLQHVTRYIESGVKMAYTYYDIDKNGTKELIVGVTDSRSRDFHAGAIYAYNPNSKSAEKIYFQDTLERGTMSVYDNGIIHTAGAGGAALHFYSYGTIGNDGYSYNELEYIEEEYKNESTKPEYSDVRTGARLSYKSLDDIQNKYLRNAKELSFENYNEI